MTAHQLSPKFRDRLTDTTRAWDMLCTGVLMALLVHHTSTAHWAADIILCLLAIVAMLFMGKLWGMHTFTRQKDLLSQLLAAGFSYVSLFAGLWVLIWLRGIPLSADFYLQLTAGVVVALAGHAAVIVWGNAHLKRGRGLRHVLLFTEAKEVPQKLLASIKHSLTQAGILNVALVHDLGTLQASKADDIILLDTLPEGTRKRRTLINALALIPSHIWQHRAHIDHGLTPNSLGSLPLFSLFPRPFEGRVKWLKRALDLAIAVPVLLVIWPLLLAIAPLNPLLYGTKTHFKQGRSGVYGNVISLLKFQSFRVSDAPDAIKQATKGDNRITPLGAFLRKTSLDELPQIWNVLKGEMSLVGPRPHALAHDTEYAEKITGYHGRFRMPPGITGWAQVNGWRGETDTLDKMENRVWHDLAYVHNWSILLDIKILLRTLLVTIHKNAY